MTVGIIRVSLSLESQLCYTDFHLQSTTKGHMSARSNLQMMLRHGSWLVPTDSLVSDLSDSLRGPKLAQGRL